MDKALGTFAWNPNQAHKFKSCKITVFAIDRHPTIQQHKDYLDKHVLPSLGISQKQTKKTNYWIDTINKLYETCHKDFDLFCANIEDKISNRNNYYRGF